MSKKKNTLKDLDEFLKQQAATLVSPSRLGEQAEPPATVKPVQSKSENTQAPSADKGISVSTIIAGLKQLSREKGDLFTEELSTIILSAMDDRTDHSPEEKMLINTALYLKHGSNWKEEIIKYWRNKKS